MEPSTQNPNELYYNLQACQPVHNPKHQYVPLNQLPNSNIGYYHSAGPFPIPQTPPIPCQPAIPPHDQPQAFAPHYTPNCSPFQNQYYANNRSSWVPPPMHLPPPTLQQHFFKAEQKVQVSQTKSQKQIDKDWLTNWLPPKEKLQQGAKSDLQVNQISMKLREAFNIIADLKICKQSLISSKGADTDMWNFKMRRITRLKERLEAIKQEILKPEVILSLKNKIKKAKKKKERRIRKQKETKEMAIKNQEEREAKHKELDSWQKQLRAKVLEEKQKAEMKAEADNILGEVRKKIQEARRLQQQLVALEKLRNARKENSSKKGLHVSAQSTEKFENGLTEMCALLEKQLAVYQVEEQALQVMLDTEREEIREKEEQELCDNVDKYFSEVKRTLFGSENEIPENPLLLSLYQRYIPTDINSLFRIRYEWDKFLTDSEDPLGSTVPLCWVKPDKPSSSNWALALENVE